MAKSKTVKKQKLVVDKIEVASKNNPLSAFYKTGLVKIEKETRLVSNSLVEMDRLSSGLLTLDWLFSGGFVNSLYQFSGAEASGKTTSLLHTLANAIKSNLSFEMVVDAEGTMTPKYTNNIFGAFDLNINSLLADKTNGFSYYRTNVIERVFDNMVKRLDLMPTKIWSEEANHWMYVMPKRNEHFSNLMSILNIKPDKALSTESHYYAPAFSSGPEAFIGVDSWAAMLPEEEEENQEKSRRRAIQAQAFSDHLKRISAKIADKGVLVVGINQLRKIPGQTYGDPEYEPGGEALKFYSGGRARFYSRALSSDGRFEKSSDASDIMVEESVIASNRYDKYMIKEIKNTKNKFGTPKLKTYIRVWINDHKGVGRGIDPFFDTLNFLEKTNQAKWVRSGKKSFIKFNLKDSVGSKRAKFYNSMEIDYLDFKLIVLAEYYAKSDLELLAKAKQKFKFPLDLRKSLFNQMKIDETLFISASNEKKESTGKTKSKSEPEEL